MLNPKKRFSVVEKKIIEFEWKPNVADAGRVVITERGVRGIFRASTTEEGGRWLGLLLCQLSVEMLDSQRFSDGLNSIVGTRKENKQGRYLEVVVSKRNGGGTRFLRLPAGRGRDGWAHQGVCLTDLLNSGEKPERQNRVKVEHGSSNREGVKTPTHKFFEGGEGERRKLVVQRNTESTKVLSIDTTRLENRSRVTNCAWWESVVFCESKSSEFDWEVVKNKVELLVGTTTMNVMVGGRVSFVLESKEEAWKLVSLNPLTVNGYEFNFQNWTPEFGSLKGVEELKSKWVMLKGIPVHMRITIVVAKIMETFCDSFEIEEGSLDYRNSDVVRVLMKQISIKNIPRLLFLEELGYKFPILVDIEEEVSKITGEVFSSTEFCGKRIGKEVVVVGQGGGEEGDMVEQGTSKFDTSLTDGDSVRVKPIVHQIDNGVVDNKWRPVTGKEKSNRPMREKTWVQVVNGSRYDPIRDVVDELQAEDLDPPSKAQDIGVKDKAQGQLQTEQWTSARKLQAQSGSRNSCLPGFRLSRQLLPISSSKGKNREGRIKQLARQLIQKEDQRSDLEAKSLESEVSISSPLFSKPDNGGKGTTSNLFNQECCQLISVEVSNHLCDDRQHRTESSNQQDDGISILKRARGKEHVEEGVDVSVSESQTTGFEKQLGMSTGSKFGSYFDQECSKLRSAEEVEKWVGSVIGSMVNQVGLTSTMGDKEVKDFFVKLALAKLKDRQLEVI